MRLKLKLRPSSKLRVKRTMRLVAISLAAINFTALIIFGLMSNEKEALASELPETASTDTITNADTPVSLVSFCTAPVQQGIKISWSMEKEINSDYFTLQHSSDGIHYAALDNIDGSGNSNDVTNYSYTDANPTPGTNYYRLTQTAFDGTEKTSNSISINRDDEPFALSVVNFNPNPFTGEFSITYNSEKTSATQIEIRSPEGKLVFTQPVNSREGINRYDFNKKTNLSKGIYFVSLSQGENKSEAKQIVKY